MKKREGYPFANNDDQTEFYFDSIGQHGTIRKMVKFTFMGGGFCNLAFGDMKADGLDDETVSNNNDMRKVIQTLVNIVHSFTEIYSEQRIVIFPVDRKRKLLYNRIFQQFEEEVLIYYAIEGHSRKPRMKEPYEAGKIYDAFVLVPEKPIFEPSQK